MGSSGERRRDALIPRGLQAYSARRYGSDGLLPGRNLQIGKVTLGARSDPQCDSSAPRLELQIVDDEAGLLGSVHVEPRFAAFHLHLEFGPDTGLQINVRLILFGSLLPRS